MSLKEKIAIPQYSLSEELMSAISHGIGALLGVAGLVLCIVISAIHGSAISVVASCIYGVTIILLYTMSTLYHSLKVNNAKRVFRIIDHCSIYLLIAGSYTPYTLVTLKGAWGWTIFGVIWGAAILGIVLNSIDIKKFKNISMALYLIAGWCIIFSFKSLWENLNHIGILFTLLGGIMYTIGAIIYGVGKKYKYMHSIFHIFCIIASVFFFITIYFYVL